MNRHLIIWTAALILLAGADYLGGTGLGRGELALLRLVLPCAVLASLMGAFTASYGWVLASSGAGLYGALQIASAILHAKTPDWSYVGLPVVAAIMSGVGESVRRAYAERIAAELCRDCLLTSQNGHEDKQLATEVVKLLRLDRAVLTEGGLVAKVLREDAQARQSVRFASYALIMCLVVVYHLSGVYWTLWLALSVLAGVGLTALHQFAVTARPPLAFDSLLAGYYELAALEFAEAVRANERDAKARIGLGIAQLHLSAFDRATAELEAARQVAFHRFSMSVWVGVERVLGLALREARKPSLAARAFRNVLALFPDHPQTLYDLGLCYLESGLERRGMEQFRRAAALGHHEAELKVRDANARTEAAEEAAGRAEG